MTISERMADIKPVRLSLDSKFKFKCHSGVKCFTKCCRDINIALTPYDIIRLKNRLQLSSDEFLAMYTVPRLLEKTDLPMVTLRMMDDDLKSCPFVTDNGCIIYEDRPTTCRYYPLGVASLSHREGVDDEGFYFFVHESHCLGFEEKKEWTVREWRKDQGVDIHDEINAGWTDLVSYNIDKFKQFVFESSFLNRYHIDNATVEKIREDEIALLEFGLKWLKDVLYKEGSSKVKESETD
ncbi:MAG: YkgJ family cysteine cluster protein [Deltaproteobacteria bacterium]|nr:YkgJ family cysteine cluster protein [Deltaproteobacteria bacterium]